MALDILIAVTVTSVIQSGFGVGVLLFGTPILLGLGYDFIKAITRRCRETKAFTRGLWGEKYNHNIIITLEAYIPYRVS